MRSPFDEQPDRAPSFKVVEPVYDSAAYDIAHIPDIEIPGWEEVCARS